jgi:hypothetical protein
MRSISTPDSGAKLSCNSPRSWRNARMRPPTSARRRCQSRARSGSSPLLACPPAGARVRAALVGALRRGGYAERRNWSAVSSCSSHRAPLAGRWCGARGNPVGIRDCPAAVCRNDRRLRHWSYDWEATAIRCTDWVRACESEDLPVVLGAPRPAAHRLVEWAEVNRRSSDRFGSRPMAMGIPP